MLLKVITTTTTTNVGRYNNFLHVSFDGLGGTVLVKMRGGVWIYITGACDSPWVRPPTEIIRRLGDSLFYPGTRDGWSHEDRNLGGEYYYYSFLHLI